MDKTVADEIAWLEKHWRAANHAMLAAAAEGDHDLAHRLSDRCLNAVFRAKWLRGELPADFDRPDLIRPL